MSLFYLHRVTEPGILVWDEQYYVPAAHTYLEGEKATYRNRRSPPLGKEGIALSIRLFGDNFFAYRLPSALSAALLGALLFWTAAWLTDRWEAGILAATLWVTSTLGLLHARLAMLDMPTALFFFAGAAALLPVLRNPQTPRRAAWLQLACLAAALGGLIKPLGYLLFPLFAFGLFTVRGSWPLRRSLPQLLTGALVWGLGSLVLCYAVIGYSPGEIPAQWRLMFALQTQLHKDYAGLSRWYQWFLGQGELWYLSQPGPDGRRYAALCTQNLVLWAAGTLAALGLEIQGLRRRQPVDLFLATLVPAQLLFWILFKEQQILAYGLPLEPVFCLAIAYLLSEWLRPALHYRVWGACLALAALFFFWKNFTPVLGSYLP